MFIDAIHDYKQGKIQVVERTKAGNRRFVEYPADYTFYYTHPAGTYKTMYGDSCKKYSTNNKNRFNSELKKIESLIDKNGEPRHKIFESDINPIFRCLSTHYKNCDAPVPNIGFFDIETGFCQERGYAPVADPFNPITAISIYLSHEDRCVTLVLKPDEMDCDEAEDIASKFDDTILFDDETEMLSAFLTVIEDVDILSGWNCLPLSQSVWLKDRITKLGLIKKNDITSKYGKVLATTTSGIKKVNRITFEDGRSICASDEHRIPIMQKKESDYKNPSTLQKSCKVMTVLELKELLNSGNHCFMEGEIRKNDNPDYTYRQFVSENIEYLMGMDWFDISFGNNKELVKKYKENANIPYSRIASSSQDYPNFWTLKNHSVSSEDIRHLVDVSEEIVFNFSKNRAYTQKLDIPIENAFLQLIGIIFTDGTFYKKVPQFTISGKDAISISAYRDIVLAAGSSGPKKLSIRADGTYAIDMRRGSSVGLLSCMIYNPEHKKAINVSMISRLSSSQFSAFFSGLIDGDGYVAKNALCLCNFDDNINNIHELLAWNGVYATSTANNLIRITNSVQNLAFIKSLTLNNTFRKEGISKFKICNISNSPSKKIRKFVLGDKVILKIKDITQEDAVEMGDIMTEESYFSASGFKVHNSTLYDIPYVVNRIKAIMQGDRNNELCLWGRAPFKKMVPRYGKEHETYDLVGRCHLDYLELYQKHNPKQMLSYRLDYIGEMEVGENKVAYEGTLDDLYKKDFDKFIEYSRQDVMLLVKIDQKKKFIGLANQIAHSNSVLFKTTMGSVTLVEQAILNEMHDMGMIAPCKKIDLDEYVEFDFDEEDNGETYDKGPVVGAYVAKPKIGLQEQIGCVDINSLYPSAIRALNISPETIVGQILPTYTTAEIKKRLKAGVPRSECWDGLFATLEFEMIKARTQDIVTIRFDDQSLDDKIGTAEKIHDYLFDPKNKLCVSANGTIFSTKKEGVIPLLLAKWYSQRKEMQAMERQYTQLAGDGIKIENEDLIRELLKLM